MSSSAEFVTYVIDQLSALPFVYAKKLFGEYCIYVEGTPVFFVAKNMVFAKKRAYLKGHIDEENTGKPFHFANECYIINIEDRKQATFLANLIAAHSDEPKT